MYPIHAVSDAAHLLATSEDRSAAYFSGETRGYRLEPWHDSMRSWGADLWVDANPEREPRVGWLGHLINDAAVCSGGSDAEILKYYAAGHDECNCAMLPLGEAAPLMAVFTTRQVERGEELLLSCECAVQDCRRPPPPPAPYERAF